MLDVYVINLAERTDRWERIQTSIGMYVNLIRVDAIKHDDGVIGCFMSHKKCLQMAKDKNLDNIIVFEDDCVVSNKYTIAQKLKELIEFLNNYADWDIFLGGCTKVEQRNIIKRVPHPNLNLIEINKGNCTHCMIYNKSSYDFFLNHPLNIQIDNAWNNTTVRGLTITPFLAYQEAGHSDILNSEMDYTKKLKRCEKLLCNYVSI
jgi:hypothetical protein